MRTAIPLLIIVASCDILWGKLYIYIMQWICVSLAQVTDRGIRIRYQTQVRYFTLFTVSRPTWPPTASVHSVPETLPGRENVYLPESNADVKNAWIYTPTPPYAFMAWCLKQKHNLKYITLQDSRCSQRCCRTVWPLKGKTMRPFETSGTTHPKTRRHTPEDQSPHPYLTLLD